MRKISLLLLLGMFLLSCQPEEEVFTDLNLSVKTEIQVSKKKDEANRIRVRNIEALRKSAFPNTKNRKEVLVLGYYQPHDEGGGIFYWDLTSAEKDNGGTIIKSYNKDLGRWKRIHRDTINVKWFGAKSDAEFESENGTDNNSYFQKALSLGGIIKIPPGNYLTSPFLDIQSNTSLIIQGTIKIFSSERNSYYLFGIEDKENINISGGTLIGDKYSHLGSSGEWGMGIKIGSSRYIVLQDIHVREFWGDGIYIGSSNKSNTLSSNISINKVESDNNRRQGLSIVNAEDVIVSNSIFSNTSGHPPQSGIDIEPNNGNIVRNAKIINCSFFGNQGSGIEIVCPGPTRQIENILVKNINSSNNSKFGIVISSPDTNLSAVNKIKILESDFSKNLLAESYFRNSKNIQFFKNRIESDSQAGIYSFRVENLEIVENVIKSKGEGILLDSYSHESLITENKIESLLESILNTKDDISQGLQIRNNKLTSESKEGIKMGNLLKATISNNEILEAGKDGIFIKEIELSVISENYIQNVGTRDEQNYSFIYIDRRAENNTIKGNTLDCLGNDSSFFGLNINNSINNNIFENIFKGENFLKKILITSL